MAFDIEWSDEAEFTFDHILNFINNGWGEAVATKFVSKANQTLEVIKIFPMAFPETAIPNIRKAVISPQTSIHYVVYDDYVYLLFFWDNRQDPLFM